MAIERLLETDTSALPFLASALRRHREVSITEAGREVLAGRADHIQLNGIDRWLGGVHLKGPKAASRWDGTHLRAIL